MGAVAIDCKVREGMMLTGNKTGLRQLTEAGTPTGELIGAHGLAVSIDTGTYATPTGPARKVQSLFHFLSKTGHNVSFSKTSVRSRFAQLHDSGSSRIRPKDHRHHRG